MKTKFTKGKWEIGQFAQKVWADNRKGCVASCSNEYHNQDFYVGFSKEEMHANALLISKAPEMFEMIQELLKELRFHGYNNSTTIYNAEQLLKEATEL